MTLTDAGKKLLEAKAAAERTAKARDVLEAAIAVVKGELARLDGLEVVNDTHLVQEANQRRKLREFEGQLEVATLALSAAETEVQAAQQGVADARCTDVRNRIDALHSQIIAETNSAEGKISALLASYSDLQREEHQATLAAGRTAWAQRSPFTMGPIGSSALVRASLASKLDAAKSREANVRQSQRQAVG